MPTAAQTSAAAAEAVLAFWAEAGVDACYDDAPVDRMQPPAPVAQRATERAAAAVVAPCDTAEAAATARRLAAEAESIEALAQAIAGFSGCGLSSLGARRAVFARGPADAPLLVIGEAPGAEEDAGGEAHVGPAGRLLDRMLEAIGFQHRALLTYSVFWRPPGDRAPTAQEQAACLPFLERALALVQPRAVLLLGAVAARPVLKTEGPIVRLRGDWRDWRLAEGGHTAPALITFSPDLLLRQPLSKRAAWADLKALRERLSD